MKQRILALITLLITANALVWLIIFFVSRTQPLLIGLAAVAYGLGLRHAVDADHIAAIDNTTRTLIAKGQRPVGVGFFFSLGHSLVVILLSLLVAISVSFVRHRLPGFETVGVIIGTVTSILFLFLVGTINSLALIQLVRARHSKETGISESSGIMTRILRPLLRVVNKSWHMLVVGFLFGLGFDTATEVGLLSMAAATGATGIPLWQIMLLPLAFTAGMTLFDSLNGMLMLGAYQWAYLDVTRKFYYNATITATSAAAALAIGVIEALRLSAEYFGRGGVFALASRIDFRWLGYGMIGFFITSWLVAWAVYKFRSRIMRI